MSIQRIALTSGEPAGIGPDLCLQLAQFEQPCQIVVLADPDLLKQRAKQLKLSIAIENFKPTTRIEPDPTGTLSVLPVTLAEPGISGELNPANSHYVLDLITRATQGCLDGLFDAMVTAPVHKGVINDAGIAFSGHTEFIADLTGGHPVMMLATPGLRVALATTHLPLAEVSNAITVERLTRAMTILNQDLRRRFSIKAPRILVSGLNPHAGEGGHLGREEITVIEPVLNKLRSQGINIQGPLPADTIFTPKYLQNADVVLVMYHDQGLPVLKYLGFGQAVNITLGLSIIRTSVDHGTALDLAGSGAADIGSLQYAVKTAVEMAKNNEGHLSK